VTMQAESVEQREPVRKQRGRPFKPGVSGNPSGRPRRRPSKKTLRGMLAAAGTLPIEYLLSVMTDAKASRRDRMEAAKALLPYTSRKLPEHDALDMPSLDDAPRLEQEPDKLGGILAPWR